MTDANSVNQPEPDYVPVAPPPAPQAAQPGPYGAPLDQGAYPAAPAGPGWYPVAPAGYPAGPGGYPPAPGGYPATGGAYPPAQGAYTAAQGAYPVAPAGYPAYQPPQGASGYPAPAYGGYPYLPPSGRKFWALLFLSCIPYVGGLVALVVALVQRAGAKSSPLEIVRENARWAANWMLSFVLYVIVLFLLIAVLGGMTTAVDADDVAIGWMIAVPGILLVFMGIYCLVEIIVGTVRADRFVHRPVLAIPFFRA